MTVWEFFDYVSYALSPWVNAENATVTISPEGMFTFTHRYISIMRKEGGYWCCGLPGNSWSDSRVGHNLEEALLKWFEVMAGLNEEGELDWESYLETVDIFTS